MKERVWFGLMYEVYSTAKLYSQVYSLFPTEAEVDEQIARLKRLNEQFGNEKTYIQIRKFKLKECIGTIQQKGR